ncbi:MAG: hypothetical protein ABSE21_19805 [Bryobacteraceae bacterium]|jgi:hypothetical protein
MRNLQDPETKPEGELTDEQTSDLSGGLNPQPLPPLELPRY